MATSGTELTDPIVSNLDIAKTFDDNIEDINGLAFSDNGDFLVTSSLDDSLNCYKISSGTKENTFYSREEGIANMTYTHHVSNVLCSANKGNDRGIRYWSMYDNSIVATYRGHEDKILDIKMNPASDAFVTTEMSRMCLWDLRAATLQGSCQFNITEKIKGKVAYDPTGSILALVFSAGNCSTIKIFNTHKMTLGAIKSWDIPAPIINAIQFSDNGLYVLAMTNRNQLFVINAFQGSIMQEISAFNNESGTSQATFTSCSNYILVSDETNNGVVVFSSKNGGKIGELKGHHPKRINCLAWSPEHLLMVSACKNLVFWVPDYQAISNNSN